MRAYAEQVESEIKEIEGKIRYYTLLYVLHGKPRIKKYIDQLEDQLELTKELLEEVI